jgi:Fe-S-cluster containining protein
MGNLISSNPYEISLSVKTDDKHNGYFQGCNICTEHCCLFQRGDINMYVGITEDEIKQIEQYTGKNDFINTSRNRSVLKHNADGYCIFVNKHGCTLNKYRPLSCRVYPYGVIKKDYKFWLFRWTDICPSFTVWDDGMDFTPIIRMFLPLHDGNVFVYDEWWDCAGYKLLCVITDDIQKLNMELKS